MSFPGQDVGIYNTSAESLDFDLFLSKLSSDPPTPTSPSGRINANLSSGKDNVTGEGPLTLGLPLDSQICLIVLYTCTTLLSVIGNILVIVVFSCGKFSRTDLRGFLINLAVADLIMAIFCMPFTFTMTMLSNWIFSSPMCPIVLYMQTVSVTASVSTNMAIGVDRFWVVTFPLKSLMTKSRSKVVIAVIWILSLAISSVQLFIGKAKRVDINAETVVFDCIEEWPEPVNVYRRTYTFFILISTYVLPLTSLTLTYGLVGWKLWQRTAPGNKDEERDRNQLRSKRKVIKMLIMVVVLFGICWLPLHVFILIIDFHPELTQYETKAQEKFFIALYYTVHWLAMSNSFANPIIYGFMNDSFRNDLRYLWRKWLPCCRRHGQRRLSQVNSFTMRSEFSRCDSRYGYGRDRGDRHNSCVTDNVYVARSSSSSSTNKNRLRVQLNGAGGIDTNLECQERLITPRNGHRKDSNYV